MQWARAALVGQAGEDTPALVVARMVGAALRDSFAEPLVADTVLAIDESIRSNDTRRIASLARGHLLYAQAHDAVAFEEAARALDHGRSPMVNVARYLAITSQFDAVHVEQSLAQLSQLERNVSPTYRGLQAMVNSAIGHCLAERGDFDRALDLYISAEHVFEATGVPDGIACMRTYAAHMLTLMGHPVEAWRVRRPALRLADASGDPVLVEFVLGRTASDEFFNREEFRALALYESVLPLPPLYASPHPGHPGYNEWRNPAPLLSRQVMLDSLAGRPLPPTVQNDLRFAQAISICYRRPEQAEKLLSEVIDFDEATGRIAMLPYVYFYRGIARREAKKEDDAISDLNHSISVLEARRRNINRRDLRNLWFRTADDPFHELMNLYWNRGDDGAAFALGERRRGLVFLDGVSVATDAVNPLTAEQISTRLDPGTAVIVFTASPRYSLSTLIEKDRVVMHRLPGTGVFLDRKRRLRAAIEKDQLPDIHSIAEELYDLLVAPLGINASRIQRLVVVADQPLHDLPFAVLRDRKANKYLIEQFDLVRVASASVYAQAKGNILERLETVLAIGDPAFDQNICPSCPALPGARTEALAVARQYPRSRTLVGADATFDQFAAGVQAADVIHIGTHAVPSVEERQVLNLLLAPSGQHPGTCSVGEAAGLPLKKGSIVVVSGCQTAASREPGTLRDFAGSFLAAGARHVVATLWDVDDDQSRTFALVFHRELRRCHNAVTATREAQLSMLRSSDRQHRSPRAWSGFQVFSVGS
ncbi:MAG TPA: CHAT domain-containing protein [Thermoanaerobaculia bacterium]|nr:CHAT domain-containing protein [Thermoanaerobaculia bacterium]